MIKFALCCCALASPSYAAVDFDRQIAPVIEQNCLACHGSRKGNAGLRLNTREAALKGGWSGKVVVPGDSAKSPLYTTLEIPSDKARSMPPGRQLPLEQRAAIKQWIDEG